MITVWKDGTYKLWSSADALHAANDPDWLVNISPEPEPVKNILDWLRGQELDHYSQFTIDWVEQIISDADDRIERGESLSWKDEEASIRYDAENVLAIMRPDVPDVEFFNSILHPLFREA